MTVEEISKLAKIHKNKFKKYFYVGFYLSDKSLQEFEKHELNAMCLLSLEQPMELVQFLRLPMYELEDLLNNPPYKHFTIPKKRSGTREIFAPEKSLKLVQKRLNYFLQAYYLWIKPKEVHGFVVKPHYMGTYCNIVENAKVHVNKKYVLNMDLKDFFPSISAAQVKELFSSSFFNFSEQIATALTLLTTYKGKLPIGAPTSPVISNFICYQLDHDLINFCLHNDLTFTRYADDLTFSSNSLISYDITLDIINLIKKNFFEVNNKKVHLKTSNRKQTVTGLTVNDKVNVNRKLLKKIRAMLHDLNTNGWETATKKHFNLKGNPSERAKNYFINRLEGYINFVGQVRGKNDVLYYSFNKSMIVFYEQQKLDMQN